MERNNIKEIIKQVILKIISNFLCFLILFGQLIIIILHITVPFFPVLFLFDLFFWAGYYIFLESVLKKEWSECIKDEYLKIKYLLLPSLIMELVVLLYYHKATFFIINGIIESNGWK